MEGLPVPAVRAPTGLKLPTEGRKIRMAFYDQVTDRPTLQQKRELLKRIQRLSGCEWYTIEALTGWFKSTRKSRRKRDGSFSKDDDDEDADAREQSLRSSKVKKPTRILARNTTKGVAKKKKVHLGSRNSAKFEEEKSLAYFADLQSLQVTLGDANKGRDSAPHFDPPPPNSLLIHTAQAETPVSMRPTSAAALPVADIYNAREADVLASTRPGGPGGLSSSNVVQRADTPRSRLEFEQMFAAHEERMHRLLIVFANQNAGRASSMNG